MARRIAVCISSLALCLGVLVAAPAGATVKTLGSNGGSVTFFATVRNAWTCTWRSSPAIARFNTTMRCPAGRISRTAHIGPNATTRMKRYTVTLTATGSTTAVARWTVNEAATAPPTTTTTTTAPTTTTTTLPSGQCVVGSCELTFSAPDAFGATGLAVGGVVENVPCPDPGVCDLPAGEQLDAVALAMSTGPSGMANPGYEVFEFSLALVGGGQGAVDSITFDTSVSDAMGALGAEAADTDFGAAIFFDVPIGSSWSSVNYSLNSQSVYSFLP